MTVNVVSRKREPHAMGGMSVRPVHDRPAPYTPRPEVSRFQQLHRAEAPSGEEMPPKEEAAEAELQAEHMASMRGDEIDRALAFYRKYLEKRRRCRKKRRETVKAKLKRLAELESKAR